MGDDRTPILYLAPWVDLAGPDKGTIDWFKHIGRQERWAPSLITTQPSSNRLLREVEPFAEEAWDLPDLMPGSGFPKFILGFIESRGVKILQIMDARLGFDLLPDIACLPEPPTVVVRLHDPEPGEPHYVEYVSRRYGNLVDTFSVASQKVKDTTVANEIPASRIEVIPATEEAGARHETLYERLLAQRPSGSRWRNKELLGGERAEFDTTGQASPQPLKLPRSPRPERSVGIIVPCYRHGIFLDECLDSVKSQTLKPARIVVVDDGSDDQETTEAIARLDRDPEIEVIRQARNEGPSAARNRALEVLDTSYVLPIDADDKLLPDALERMLARLEAAPEDVGFVYPHAQHFGNRTDFVRLPAYNLWLLMKENYCPAPALFDRRIFDPGGVAYPEDIVVGHEDWDLVLQLGERCVYGVHADGPTFLYRRQGFSRVNAVDYGPHEFHQAIERRHPWLYRDSDAIKSHWAPALSLVLLDEGGSWSDDDLAELRRQTCLDFEVLAQTELGDGVRAVGTETSSPAEWLQAALAAARGRWICILSVAATDTLRMPSFVEQMLYGFEVRNDHHMVVLGRGSGLDRHTLAQLDDSERQQTRPVGIVFERRAVIQLPDVDLSNEEPIMVDLVTRLQTCGVVQWRLLPVAAGADIEPEAPARFEKQRISLNIDRSLDKSEFATRDLIAHESPRLPELTPGTARRWEYAAGWSPPGTWHLCRHISQDESHRIVANHRYSPPGYSLEFDLGAVHIAASPGMRRLVHADHSFELIDDQNVLDESRHGLGYVEQEPLPQLERLELRRLPANGEMTLVAGHRDPLFEVGELVAAFGWIESFPLNPQDELVHTAPWRAVPLLRQVEQGGHRHRYRAGDESGDATDIGWLYPYPGEGLVALRRRSDGRLASDLARPGRASRDPRRFARWIAASPAHSAVPTGQGSGGRLLYLAGSVRSRQLVEDEGIVLGGLRSAGGRNLYPLFSTTHPVTGDQLVTCTPHDAIARGYLQDGVLGYIHVSHDRPLA